MASRSTENLVDERVTQLDAISERRNVLLREMYHMMRRRQNVGSVFTFDDEDEGDLHVFLQRFDLIKNPESGTIAHLPEDEFFASPPSSSRQSVPVAISTTRSWSKPKSPKSESTGPERRSQLYRDVKKVERRSKSRTVAPDPSVEMNYDLSRLPSTPTHFATNSDQVDSDDVLASAPPEGQPSAQKSTPHLYQEDDDERDELDLIGSLPPSPSPRSGTSQDHRTQSASHQSAVIHIVDSPEPGQEIQEQEAITVEGPRIQEHFGEEDRQIQDDEIQVLHEENKVISDEEEPKVISGDEDQTIQEVVHEHVMPKEEPVLEEDLQLITEEEWVQLTTEEDRMVIDGETTASHETPVPQEDTTMTDPPIVEETVAEKTPTVDLVEQQALGEVSSMSIEAERNTAPEELPINALNTEPKETESASIDSTVITSVRSPRAYFPLVPFVPSVTVDLLTTQRPVMIPTPSSPVSLLPVYNFETTRRSSSPSPQQPTSPTSPTQPRHHFNPQYTLPPLKALPVEFNRKGKLTKQQRKRDKEREKIEKGSERGEGKKEKEEWVPMGVNKWGATVRTNPVWKRVARSSKCLSTREWNVAMTELRLIRTLDRVESLKDGGRWSFRQPKKQRGIGGLTKTHWDHLMDEMRWMRIDFREERKWKLALAYNLSTAVLEWHAAGSLAERVAMKICVLWKRPKAEEVVEMDEDVAGSADDHVEVDDVPAGGVKSNPLAMVDYGSDDDDDDEADKSVEDALEPIAVVQDALDGVDGTAQKETDQMQVDGLKPVEPKVEDMDDSSALQGGEPDETMDVDTQPVDHPSGEEINAKEEEPSSTLGLKITSTDPVLGSKSNSQSTVGDGEPATSSSKLAAKPNVYAPMREWIAYSDDDKLFLDLDDFNPVRGSYASSTESDLLKLDALPPPDLSAIFPDLHPLGLLDVVPSTTTSTAAEGKRKSEKRSDRDDPNKRAEDITYTKLAPIGPFMYCKPTLLGPLQPAKFWKHGRWSNLDESMSISESDSPLIKMLDENMCELFEGNKPGSSPAVNTYMLPPPQDPRKRVDHMWTMDDDNLLKRLADKYPNNWPLICDSFNSSRVTISTDKRTPWDCLERWDSRWGGSRLVAHPTPDLPSSFDGTPTPPQMTTRGVKRQANSNTSAPSPWIGLGEPKRRRRHILMLETIRKAVKKRDASQKSNSNQRKSTQVHDTHNQYNKMPKLTPAELSRMKADKEARDNQEMMLAKRRHEERQNSLHNQTHRMQVQPNIQQAQMLQQQQQQQQQQQPNGAPRPAGAGIPPAQGVPQIRSQVNISQQQRIPTPMAAANTRMSPQQLIHVQTQAAQARAMAAVQAQVQTQNGQANLNGLNNTHLSPTYASRAATSSPAQSSPPRSSSTPLINPPRPPSAQSQVGMVPVPVNALPRQPNMGHYFPVATNLQTPVQGQFTPEQMEQALRLHSMMAHRAGMSQAQNGSYPPQS